MSSRPRRPSGDAHLLASLLGALALISCAPILDLDDKSFVESAGTAGASGASPGGQGGAGSGGSAGATSGGAGSGGSAGGPGGASGGAGMNGGSAGANGGSSGTNGGSAGSVTAGSAGANVGGASAGMSGAAGSAGGVTRPSWARRFGVSDLFESIREVRVTTSAIYALGVSTPSPAVNPDEGLLARFTLDGDLVWAKTYQQFKNNEFTHLEVLDGFIVVTGTTYGETNGSGHFWLLGVGPTDGAVAGQFLSDEGQSAGISIWGMCPLLDGTGVLLGVQKNLQWKGFQRLTTTVDPASTVLEPATVFMSLDTLPKNVFPERLSVYGSRYLYSGSYDDSAATLSLSGAFEPLTSTVLLPPAQGLIVGDALPRSTPPGQAWLSYGTRSQSPQDSFRLYAAQFSDKSNKADWANEYSLDVGPYDTHAAEVSDGFVLVAASAGSPPSPLLMKIDAKGALTWARSLGTAFRVSSIAGVPGTGSVVLGGVTCDAGVIGCKNPGEAALVRVAADGSIDGYSKSSALLMTATAFTPSLSQGITPSPADVFTKGHDSTETIHVQPGTATAKDWKLTVGAIE